jgi:hypothetical protein
VLGRKRPPVDLGAGKVKRQSEGHDADLSFCAGRD